MTAIDLKYVENDWSSVIDSVISEKPKFIKHTREYIFLADFQFVEHILEVYNFTATEFIEDNGSITLALNEMDLVENGDDKNEAIMNMAKGILEYSEIFYDNFNYWSVGNRRTHIPYVFKALILNDVERIKGFIKCHPGGI